MKRFVAWLFADGALARYLVVGVGISLLDLALFSGFALVVGLHEVAANVLSTIIAVCASYFINRAYVFRADRISWRSFFSFAGVTLFTGLVLQSLIIWLLVSAAVWEFVGLSEAAGLPVVKIFAMGVGAFANFLGYRLVFRGGKQG